MFEEQFRKGIYLKLKLSAFILAAVLLSFVAACQNVASFFPKTAVAKSLRDVPAQRLNYNFEADVPLPANAEEPPATEKFSAVQADFDARRPTELLERTIFSPDKQRILALYRKPNDVEGAYRLDLYGADGKFLRSVTPNNLSLAFPNVVQWSPDSNNVAFIGVRRLPVAGETEESAVTAPTLPDVSDTSAANANTADANTANANIANDAANANANLAPKPLPNTPPVAAFTTEQVYLFDREGNGLKPLTLKEGLIYFYLAWSPDSAALAALACRNNEWDVRGAEYPNKIGRPRVIEKNGRERLLDDNLTDVPPIWSPDAAKIAVGFGTDIKIYDALVETPTYAVVPLRVPLFNSSQIFDANDKLKQQANANVAAATANVTAANINAATNTNAANKPVAAPPVTNAPASFNPIVRLRWAEDKTLFFQTGYVRSINNEITQSFMRWHRLDLSPQVVAVR